MSTAPTERTWLQRNTKWIVIGAIGAGLLVLAGLIAAIALVVSTAVRSSEVYQTSVARAQADPRVVEALGDPVEAGIFVTGSIQVDGSEGSARMTIPLSGPRAGASLYVEAAKHAGRWRYDEMRVSPDATTAAPIDLIASSERDAGKDNIK